MAKSWAAHDFQTKQVQHIQRLLQLQGGLASLKFNDEAVARIAEAGNVNLLERQRTAALTDQTAQVDG